MKNFILLSILLLTISFSQFPYLSVMDKHVLVNFDNNFEPHLDIFTGDLPYVISYNDEEGLEFYLKLYMMFYMLPQDTNIYVKLGKYLQIGYIDEYSRTTFLYQFYFGAKSFSDFFMGWTSKIKDCNFGLKLYNDGGLIPYFGFHSKKINFSMYYDNSLNLNFDYRFRDFYTVNLKYYKKVFSIGVGISWFNNNFYDVKEKKTKYFAHRGQLNKYPENSRVAFLNTLKDDKYIGIETDVNETKDGRYAVIHDPFMFRFTGSLKTISSYTMNQLKKIDISSYFHYKAPIHIMELKDLAKLFGNSDKILIIEIKSCGNTEKDVIDFLDYVNRYFPPETRVWFSSLDSFWVKEIKKLNTRRNSKVLYIYPFLMVSQSDYIYPLIDSELASVVKDVNPDGIIWFKPKVDLFSKIKILSRKYKIDMLYWDFANEIYYYNFSKK